MNISKATPSQTTGSPGTSVTSGLHSSGALAAATHARTDHFAQVLRHTLAKQQTAGSTSHVNHADAERALRDAVTQFEAYLLHQLLSTMRKSLPAGGVLPGSFARDVYQDMHDGIIADAVAAAGGLGVGELLFDQLNGTIGFVLGPEAAPGMVEWSRSLQNTEHRGSTKERPNGYPQHGGLP